MSKVQLELLGEVAAWVSAASAAEVVTPLAYHHHDFRVYP